MLATLRFSFRVNEDTCNLKLWSTFDYIPSSLVLATVVQHVWLHGLFAGMCVRLGGWALYDVRDDIPRDWVGSCLQASHLQSEIG